MTGRQATATGWRMRPRTRKATLVVHIVAAGAWIGIDVVLGVLVFTALPAADTGTAALSYQALPLLFWPMLTAAVVCLASGVALGLGTRYGLLRYWWVAVKLVLNVALVTLIAVVLQPGLDEAAAHGRAVAAGGTASTGLSSLLFPPIVSTTALLVATVLAVYRPWGRIARRGVPAPPR